MRDNREGGHAERNGNTDWKGVGEDVFSKVVFDAVGVMLQSKNNTREADTSEVKKRHFDRRKRVLHGEEDKDYG